MSALIDIKQHCKGRIAPVLVSLGYEQKLFNGKHQPCPLCGGKDRARWVRDKEYLHCNQCGPVQFMDLAMDITGESFNESANRIRGHKVENLPKITPEKIDIQKNQARIDRIKAGLKPLKGSIAEKYLINRGLKVLPERDCYFHPGIDHYNDDRVKTGTYPAMVGIVRNIEGKGATFHITYLTNEGDKAQVNKAKKLLPTVLPLTGCAIELFKPVDGVLAIAEGIETALAVYQLEGIPIWSAINAGNMAVLELPGDLTELHIYADTDPGYAGQQAAYTLARRYSDKIKLVHVHLLVNGSWATDEGTKMDFLDLLLEINQPKAA